jgi:hypothetical protein
MLREKARGGASRFRKQGNKGVGAGHGSVTQLLGVERGALIDAFERRRGLGAPDLGHDVLEIVV